MLKDRLDLYYIEWVDSRSGHPSWVRLEDIESAYCTISSVGWAIKETDEFIHLMAHIGEDPEEGCGDPKCCIVYQKPLSVLTIKSPAHKVLHDKKYSKKEKIKRGEALVMKSRDV